MNSKRKLNLVWIFSTSSCISNAVTRRDIVASVRLIGKNKINDEKSVSVVSWAQCINAILLDSLHFDPYADCNIFYCGQAMFNDYGGVLCNL